MCHIHVCFCSSRKSKLIKSYPPNKIKLSEASCLFLIKKNKSNSFPLRLRFKERVKLYVLFNASSREMESEDKD